MSISNTLDQPSFSSLLEKKILVVGYGSQGRAQALNLRDRGLEVNILTRGKGPSYLRAMEDGFARVNPDEAVSSADVIAMLVPDLDQPSVYEHAIQPFQNPGSLLLFAHGFSVHYKQIYLREDIDVGLVAPKSPGLLVRREFEQGGGVPCLFAVHQDFSGHAGELTKSYGRAIGAQRAGLIETSFAEECESDLFGEQAVLCGGVSELVLSGYQTLVEAGVREEIAYFECLHELKLIVDLLHEGGFSKMHQFVSSTASFGDLTRGPRVIDEQTRTRMREVFRDIQSGEFAREWIAEHKSGATRHATLKSRRLQHSIERVGARLRSSMPWLESGARPQ